MAMKMGFAALAGGLFLFLLGTQYAPLSSLLFLAAIVLEGLAVVLFWRGK